MGTPPLKLDLSGRKEILPRVLSVLPRTQTRAQATPLRLRRRTVQEIVFDSSVSCAPV